MRIVRAGIAALAFSSPYAVSAADEKRILRIETDYILKWN